MVNLYMSAGIFFTRKIKNKFNGYVKKRYSP